MCDLLIIQSDQKVAHVKINVFLNSSTEATPKQH